MFVLTLTGAAAHTTYFSGGPERITGLAPTQPFLDGLGFAAENPSNTPTTPSRSLSIGYVARPTGECRLLVKLYGWAPNTIYGVQ